MRQTLFRTCMLAALAALALCIVPAAATENTEPAMDTMQQRVQPCLACHAETGINLRSGYTPRLHGKPAGYLYNQLLNYQGGRRHHRAMEHMVRNLPDEYLWEIAVYFSEQVTPYTDPAEPLRDDVLRERGEELVMRGDPARDLPSCKACHGENLSGVEPNTPSLLGLPSHYVAAQLTAWRLGRRQAAEPDCMQEIAQRLTPEDIYALSRWLAANPVSEDPTPHTEPVSDPPMQCGSVPLPE